MAKKLTYNIRYLLYRYIYKPTAFSLFFFLGKIRSLSLSCACLSLPRVCTAEAVDVADVVTRRLRVREAAHKRLSEWARMKIRPEEQRVFDKHAQREAAGIAHPHGPAAAVISRRATVLTNQKVERLGAIKRTKRRERKLRRTIMKQLKLRPSTSGSLASSRIATGRTELSSRSRQSSRPGTSRSTPSLHLDSASLQSSASSTKTPSVTSSNRGDTSERAPSRAGEDSSRRTNGQRSQSRPSTSLSSRVSDQWLASQDPQAPFSARRHKFKTIGMNYVPMDFAGHEDRLRTTDGPARVARYFGRRRNELNRKLARAVAKASVCGSQADIWQCPRSSWLFN